MARSRLALSLGFGASLLLFEAAAILSCSKAPTRPIAPLLHRTLSVVVADSLGAPIPGAAVTLIADFDSAGLALVVRATTDAEGAVSAVLLQGSWGAYALTSASPARAAGATFVVAGPERPAADTLLVRLTLHTAGAARGRVTLAARTDHSGTVVACPPVPLPAITDSSGTYVLGLLPVGRWTLTFYHHGFKLGLAAIVVANPADTLTVPDHQLVTDPGDLFGP